MRLLIICINTDAHAQCTLQFLTGMLRVHKIYMRISTQNSENFNKSLFTLTNGLKCFMKKFFSQTQKKSLKIRLHTHFINELGCGVAQIVARRLAVRQARVRISARHPRGGPLLSGSDEDYKKRFSTSYIYINIVCILA
jgi:hypothetical protein